MGGHRKGDASYQAELQTVVEQDPRELGQAFSVWTCADLALYLSTQKHTLVSAETVRRYLHALGYRVLRPVLSIASPDPNYEQKVGQLEKAKEQAGKGEIILLFEDEVDLNLLPGVIRCWTKRSQQRRIPTPGQNVKRYGFGAVHFTKGQVIRHIGEHKDSANFCALIEKIVQCYCPGETWQGPSVVLVVDNYIIHRSKKTVAVLARYADRLNILSLPTYAPKLNVIELLWKFLRRKVTHNHLYESIAKVVEAVDEFFKGLDADPTQVLSVIGNTG